jgi:hypothetical protein
MIQQDIYQHLENDSPAVKAIADGGFFWRKPNNTKDLKGKDYVVFSRPNLRENDVRTRNLTEFICFSESMETVELLAEALKDNLRGRTVYNGNKYYFTRLLDQVSGKDRLENGFYYSILSYYIQKA